MLPIAEKISDEKENPFAPNRTGIYPPIAPPTLIPIQINDLFSMTLS